MFVLLGAVVVLLLIACTTMAEVVRRTRGPWQFTMRVFSIFGAIALALAVIGLFSLVTYAVNQRTREIGVRMALGASRSDVVRLLVSQAATPAVVGIAIGLAAGILVTRVLSNLLFDTSPTDPTTFALVAALLGIVAGSRATCQRAVRHPWIPSPSSGTSRDVAQSFIPAIHLGCHRAVAQAFSACPPARVAALKGCATGDTSESRF